MPSHSTSVTRHRPNPSTISDWPEDARTRVWMGVKGAAPVMIGYIPIGLSLGVLAAQAGLTPLEIGAMSVFVYAGASQFIGVGMLAAGFGPVAITLTTLLVNVRHLLMSAALSPYMKHLSRRHMAVFAFFVTDESFAVSAGEFRERGQADIAYMVGLYVTAYASWVLATVSGAFVGSALTVPEALSLDFALTAMFIGLLVGQLRDRSGVIVAVVAGVVALLGGPSLGGWSVMVASVAAATVGVGVGRWTRG